MWTCFLFRLFKRCNVPMVAMGTFPTGLGLAIEKKSRRIEISLYCLARAIESFFTCIADAGYLPQSRKIKRADVDQAPDVDVLLADADGIFHSIKALSQSDGRWRYSSDNPESSTYAAGLALEALAGVVSLASSEIDQSRVKFSLEAAKSALSNASIGMYDTSAVLCPSVIIRLSILLPSIR